MTMVANNYLDEGRPHREVIEMMALGFTGKLQQWWNNCLTEASKEDIKYAIQQDEEGNPIINEIEQGVPDGVNTLIYTIMKHFVGKPSNITSRIYDQLSNLSCCLHEKAIIFERAPCYRFKVRANGLRIKVIKF